jgi:hypothetical protein
MKAITKLLAFTVPIAVAILVWSARPGRYVRIEKIDTIQHGLVLATKVDASNLVDVFGLLSSSYAYSSTEFDLRRAEIFRILSDCPSCEVGAENFRRYKDFAAERRSELSPQERGRRAEMFLKLAAEQGHTDAIKEWVKRPDMAETEREAWLRLVADLEPIRRHQNVLFTKLKP